MSDRPSLPANWCWTSLGKLISRIEAGHSPKAEGRPALATETGVLKVSAVSWGEFLPEENKALPSNYPVDPELTVRKDDLLISRANTPELVGAVVLVHADYPNLMLSDKTLRLVPSSPELSKSFLLHALRMPWVRALFEDDATGTSESMRNLTQDKIRSAPIALPPVPEQHRIVAKLDALLHRSRRAKETLESIIPLLEAFRQSVLASAFRGELTADWRAKNFHTEPASKQLDRIRAERHHRWEEVEIEKMRLKSLSPKQTTSKRYEPPKMADASTLPELPSGWCWARMEELTEFVTSGSRGWGEYYSESGPIFIRVGNLDRNTIELSMEDINHVCPPPGAEGTRTKAIPGDILISITADVGMIGVVPEGLGDAYVNQHIALCRPMPSVNSRAIGYALADPLGLQKVVKRIQYGATKASLSLIQVRDLPVPVPPVAEQAVLVARIEQALSGVKRVETRLQGILSRHQSLNQSILTSAFRGDLAPQSPNDEPAETFLERIRAEQQLTPKPVRRPKQAQKVAAPPPHPMLKRQDLPPNHLQLIVKRRGGRMTASALLIEAAMPIEDFYVQLRRECGKGKPLRDVNDPPGSRDVFIECA